MKKLLIFLALLPVFIGNVLAMKQECNEFAESQALSDVAIEALSDNLAATHVADDQAEVLAVRLSRWDTDEDLRNVAREYPKLQVLDLGLCSNITDAGLLNLVESCRDLQFLSLSDSYELHRIRQNLQRELPNIVVIGF